MTGLRSFLVDFQAREKDSLLALEAECRLRISLANAAQQNLDFDTAMAQASQVLILADNLKLPLTKNLALSYIANCLIGLGKISESQDIISEQLARFPDWESPRLKEEYQRFMADNLYALGDHEAAFDLLERVSYESPSLTWVKAMKLLYRGLLGFDMGQTLPELDYEWASLYNWLLKIMFLLRQHDALPLINATASEREALLRRAIDLSYPGEQIRDPWNGAMERWARSLSYMRLGEAGRAGAALSTYTAHFREWLDLRLLLAGARLDLSLHLKDPGIQTMWQVEQELRSVFKDAATLPYTSRAGLAKRLMRWHPSAAAYAAVMPDAIPELQTATTMILRLGTTNSVYGFALPPVYAAELILRDLRIAQRRFVQAPLNKAQIDQRNKLVIDYGGGPYWRPVISGIRLIYGLIKAGEGRASYVQAAKNVAADFGLVPSTKASYAHGYMALIETQTQKLLNYEVDVEAFAKALTQAPDLFV